MCHYNYNYINYQNDHENSSHINYSSDSSESLFCLVAPLEGKGSVDIEDFVDLDAAAGFSVIGA